MSEILNDIEREWYSTKVHYDYLRKLKYLHAGDVGERHREAQCRTNNLNSLMVPSSRASKIGKVLLEGESHPRL